MVERIFTNSLGRPASIDDYDDWYTQKVAQMIEDATDYEESYLSLTREENTKYYQGLEPALDEDAGTSTIVSTDVRDTIMAIMPSLIRIFTSGENVIDFLPNYEGQEDMAKQATDYINNVIWKDNNGFLIMHDLLKDALTVRAGIVKWWTDNNPYITENQYTNIPEEQLQRLIYEAPDVEVMDLNTNEDGTLNFTLRYEKSKPMTRIAAVPPEEFRLDRYAKTIDSATLVGHERMERVSELVRRGFDIDELTDYISSPRVYSDERYLRNPALIDENRYADGVLFGEYLIRIDGDGDGIEELRLITTIGNEYNIVDDYIVNDVNFGLFTPDPTPHTAIGESITDIIKDIQKIKTNVLRKTLDSLAESINPRTAVNETLTNMDDVLNTEIGATIRTKGSPSEAMHEFRREFVGGDTMPVVDYLDQLRASRTGITEASKGLDPKAMQSTALSGIEAIITGAQERIELIARILAETGFAALFRGLLREVVNHPNQKRTLYIRNKWVPFDPSTFDPSLSVQVNPTLGKGSDAVKLQALQSIKESQELIIGKYGVKNALVGPTEYRNTLEDMLALVNIKNASRYFKVITPEVEEGIMSAPEDPDPALLLAQAELEKTKKDLVVASAKMDLQENQAAEDNDFRRDKLNIDSTLKAAELTLKDKEIMMQPQLAAMNEGPEDATDN